MGFLCADVAGGIVMLEMNQLNFTIREYEMNIIGSWFSVMETEFFRIGLYFKYNTVTLFSAKGLAKETYDDYLYHRFTPPLHDFPGRDEYFLRAQNNNLPMLSVCDPEEGRQTRKNIMERNWLCCVLSDLVFIPNAPKGSKTYIIAKKVVQAGIPVFTIEHEKSKDLHDLSVPAYNRKTVRKLLEDKGAKRYVEKKPEPVVLNSNPSVTEPIIKQPSKKIITQTEIKFKKNKFR
jgi:hypothetical protein